MFTSLSHKLVTAIALLLLFATSSAYGARALRGETKRALHHHATRRHRAGRSSRRPGRSSRRSSGKSADVHSAAALLAPIAPSSVLLLGDEAVESQRDSLSAGEAEAFPFQALTSGLTSAVHVYIDYRNAAHTLIVGLYANAGGHPGALLTTGTATALKARAWNTASVAAVPLASGSTYWLAVLGTGGTLRYRDRASGPCQSATSAQTTLTALPASWSTGSVYSTCPISAYLTGSNQVLDPPPPVESTPPVEPPPVESTPPPTESTPPPVESTPPPPPAAPTASFTYSPTAPVVGQAVSFKDTGSTCADGPCAYAWSDDGGTAQPATTLWPLGSGQSMSFTFHEADTKYVRLLVTDALGRTATVEHNVLVAAEPKSEPPPKTEPPVEEKHEEPPVEEKPKTEPPVEEHPKTEPPVEEKSTGKTNCINAPSACGYPDATNTGVPAGTALTSKSGEVSVTKAGTTVKDLAVTGEIDIEANNTIVEDDEITASAGSGNRGIYIAPGVTGTVIDHVTCHGAGKGTQYCIFNKDSSTKIEYSYLYNCGECLNGPGEITSSFFDVTAVISGEHYEDIYYGGGEGPLIVNHDTMLNPQGQTATVFASTDFGDQTTLTITNNLLAGGGYTLYGGTSCTTGGCGSVVGPVTVTGNRFSNKYYPDSGYYGVASYFDNAATTWSGNIWDATLTTVEE